ncbi:MAG: hypothetical protein AAGA80_25145 [Cyanobacteria bacterium P01_F01_bin.143]
MKPNRRWFSRVTLPLTQPTENQWFQNYCQSTRMPPETRHCRQDILRSRSASLLLIAKIGDQCIIIIFDKTWNQF